MHLFFKHRCLSQCPENDVVLTLKVNVKSKCDSEKERMKCALTTQGFYAS